MTTEENRVGGFIAALRKEKGLTQRQLAEQLGVTDKAVSKWERAMGYPDVTLLSKLAECLGVTVGELLSGAREEPAAPVQASQALVETALRYSQRLDKTRRHALSHVLAALLTAGCLLAAGICMICDYALNGAFTWAVYPVASLLFGWLLLFPTLLAKRERASLFLAVLSLGLLPFLLVLCLNMGGSWFLPIAVPASGAGLGCLWAVWLCFRATGNRLWAAAMVFLLAPLVDAAVSVAIWRYLRTPPFDLWDVLSCGVSLSCAAVLYYLGQRRD